MPQPVSRTSTIARPRSSADVATPISLPIGLALGDRLRGVDEQVHEHLAEARLVGLDKGHVVEVAHEAGAVADLVPHEADRGLEDAPHVEEAAVVALRARESGQIADDAAHPRGFVARDLERGREIGELLGHDGAAHDLGARVLVGAGLEEPPYVIEVRDHVREGVVDFVRDAGRERAQRGEPARLEEALFHGAARRDVGAYADDTHDVPRGAEERDHPRVEAVPADLREDRARLALEGAREDALRGGDGPAGLEDARAGVHLER